MPISFNEIPVNLRVPYVYTEYDATRANQGPGIQPYKALIIGQRLSAGTVPALTPIRITSVEQAAKYFGVGSILHRQAMGWFADNTTTEVWAVAFADPGGAQKAAGEIVFAGPATANGTLSLYIAGQRVQVGVASSDTAAEIATAVAAAINAATDLPVTAEVDGSVNSQVNVEAKNAGLLGNEISMRVNYYDSEATPAGITVTIDAKLSGGSGAPDFSTLWSVLGDEHYNVWANPYIDTASLADISDELESRAGPLRQIEAVAFGAKDDTHSNLGTFGDGQNSQFISVISPAGVKSPTPAFEIGANYAAIAAYYLSIDPARPVQTLEMSHVLPPARADRFTQQENNLLLFDGIATAYVDASGNVRIQRGITFYKENPLGADDAAYLDIETLFTLSYIRWSVRNRLLLKFPRHKLASDGTRFGQGQAVVTPKVVKAELVSLFQEWEFIALVEDADQFSRELIVERNQSDPNRLDVQMPPNLVNQLRVTAIQIQFLV